MRLVTFMPAGGHARLGAELGGGSVLDMASASGGAPEFASMLSLIEAGPVAWERARRLIEDPPARGVYDAENLVLLAPMPQPPQIRDFMCFEKHATQAFAAAFRMRASREHVFGYTIFNDFSARDTQGAEMAGGLGPAKSKDFDGANAFGPCVVTADELPDPYALPMIVRINGEERSRGSSRDMHWKFEDAIAYVSQGETLQPGEILASGTVGDGCGLEHLKFLEDGDRVEIEIPPIGVLANQVVHGAAAKAL